MIKPEQIPDAVVDALLDSSNVAKPWHHAIAAALNAWPLKTIHNDHVHWPEYPHIILPLAAPSGALTEASDE